MDAKQMLANLRKGRYAWIVYIPIATLLNVASILSGSCLAAVMVGIVTFGIPFLLGEKGLGTLLKMGTLILIISGLVLGAVVTHFLYEQTFMFEERTLHDTDLEGGIVTPYLGDENTFYNFTVTYTGAENADNVSVYVNITKVDSEEEKSFILNNSGNLFFHKTLLTSDIHNYRFAVYSNTTGGWNKTDFGIGPVAAPYSDILAQQMLWGILIIFVPGGLFFYMIALLYNSRKRAQEEQRKLAEEEKEWTAREGEEKEGKKGEEEEGKKKEEGEKETAEVIGEFECTECGADVPGDASFCPHCGEPFEEDEEGQKEEVEQPKEKTEEFECTECGADVPGDAAVCPSCGESFDEEEEPEEQEAAEKFMCTQCGADVPGDVTTCPNCGESFDGEEKEE